MQTREKYDFLLLTPGSECLLGHAFNNLCRIPLTLSDGSWAFPVADIQEFSPGKLAIRFHMLKSLNNLPRLEIFLHNLDMGKEIAKRPISEPGYSHMLAKRVRVSPDVSPNNVYPTSLWLTVPS